MKIRVELNMNDIVELIASHFDVNPDDVALTVEKVYKGHGPMETLDHEVKAIITSNHIIWD